MPHVLLIDDDQDLVAGNKAALVAKGFRVSEAYSGNDGYKALLKEMPDVVVLDCMMEEFTSGFELAHDIALKYPTLPIIMVTGVHEHMSSAWQYGPEDKRWLPIHKWMEKPVPVAKLIEAIEELVKKKAETASKP
ncbi:MAG: response regulator [Deltaproteobacteria bacterium]|nr:response regulator [Deltaproteobacteria bacterium]